MLGLFRQRQLLEWDDNSTEVNIWYIIFCILLVLFAGCMSGLTLGLLQLDIVDLEVLKRSGNAQEQRYAKNIVPLVKNAHYLLVTLLLCNAAAMETLPIFLDKMVHESVAIVISVTAVLLFGEIIPQAVCSKHGLMIGSLMACPVRALMFITAPISWPLSKLLDRVLGGDHAGLFRRKQLKALVHIHSKDEGFGGKLTADEIQIITGALDLTHKQAYHGMTPLDKVFMLSTSQLLDDSTLETLMSAKPFSRVPVYRGQDRKDVVGLLLVKELLEHVKRFPDCPVSSLKIRPIPRLCALTPMYTMLKLFRTGRAHMALLTQPLLPDREPLSPHGTPRGAQPAHAASPPSAATSTLTTPGRNETTCLLSRHAGSCSPTRHHSPRLPAALSQPLRPHSSPRSSLHPPRQGLDVVSDQSTPAACLHQLRGQYTGPGLPQAAGQDFVGDSASSLAAQPRMHCSHHHAASEAGPLPLSSPAVEACGGGGGVRRTYSLPGPAGGERPELPSTGSAPPPGAAARGEKPPRPRPAEPSVDDEEDEEEGGPRRASMPGCAAPGAPVGIITIEDVIEELMQLEIVDETDLFVDNEQLLPVADAALDYDLPDSLKTVMCLAEATKSLGMMVGAAGATLSEGATGTLRARVSRGPLGLPAGRVCYGDGAAADEGRGVAAGGGAAAVAGVGPAALAMPGAAVPDDYGGDKEPRRPVPKPHPRGGTFAGLLAAVLQPAGGGGPAARSSGEALGPPAAPELSRRPGVSLLGFGFRGGREAKGTAEQEMQPLPPELGGAAEGVAGGGRQGAAAPPPRSTSASRWGSASGGGGDGGRMMTAPLLEVNGGGGGLPRVSSMPSQGSTAPQECPRKLTLPVGLTFSPPVAADEAWYGGGGNGSDRV